MGFLSSCYFLSMAIGEGKRRANVECQYEMAILSDGRSERGRLKNCLSFGKITQSKLRILTKIYPKFARLFIQIAGPKNIQHNNQGSPVDKVILKLQDLSPNG